MTTTRYVTRRYKCNSCGNEWKSGSVVVSGSPAENCPKGCNTNTAIINRGSYNDVRQTGLKAADIAYKMAETDYGMSNMRDNQREGDIAAIMPSNPVEQTIQQQGGFYGQQSSAIGIAAGAKAERVKSGLPDPMAAVQNSMRHTPSIIESTRRNPIMRG